MLALRSAAVAMTAAVMAVGMLVTVVVQMLVGVGMAVFVGMAVAMLVGMGHTVVGVLMGMGMGMLMTVVVVMDVIMIVMHGVSSLGVFSLLYPAAARLSNPLV
jgi:hypothetical protein